MGNFFSSGKQSPSVSTVADPYGAVRTPLVNYLSQTDAGQPGKSYTGEMVAPLTSAQTQSQDTLQQYANRTPSPTYQSGEKEINDTINGNYDPSTSPYYQAIKAQAAQNLTQTNKQIENQAGGGGQYYSGARTANEANAANTQKNSLNTTLGQLQLQKEAQKAQLTPYALQAGSQDMNMPLATTAALQQYGALPQAYQQALDTANYQNWQSANIQQPLTQEQIAAGVQQPPMYAYNQQTPSPFSQMMSGPLGQMVLAGIPGMAANVFGTGASPLSASTSAFGGGTSPYTMPSTSFMGGPLSLSGY